MAAEVEVNPAREQMLGASAPFGLASTFHVLVVEDDNVCLKFVEQLLKKLDYRVTSANSGKRALEILLALAPRGLPLCGA